jgi:hypothetical protein
MHGPTARYIFKHSFLAILIFALLFDIALQVFSTSLRPIPELLSSLPIFSQLNLIFTKPPQAASS